MIQPKVVERNAHGRGEAGGILPFDLDAVPAAMLEDEEIELCPAVRSPEVGGVRLRELQDLLDGVSLPRAPQLGVAHQVSLAPDAEELVQQPAVKIGRA